MIGTRSECDRLSCERNQTVINLLYHKNNNEYFYCVNRQQLGEYWPCVIEDRDPFYPERCDKCNICKEIFDVFVELQESSFTLIKIMQIIKKIFHISLSC